MKSGELAILLELTVGAYQAGASMSFSIVDIVTPHQFNTSEISKIWKIGFKCLICDSKKCLQNS